MSVHHSVVHKVQFIVNLTTEACQLSTFEVRNIAEGFDANVVATLEKYKNVEIDKDYKRYGLDFGLVSDCKDTLSDACHDIAIHTRTNLNLNDVEFDSL